MTTSSNTSSFGSVLLALASLAGGLLVTGCSRSSPPEPASSNESPAKPATSAPGNGATGAPAGAEPKGPTLPTWSLSSLVKDSVRTRRSGRSERGVLIFSP